MADQYRTPNPVSGKTAEERFLEKVDKNGPLPERRPDLGPCWIWTASLKDYRYAQMWVNGHHLCAHRVSYEMYEMPIPDGLVIDHLCRNMRCVNPRHLEPVTTQENIARGEVGLVSGRIRGAQMRAKTHCPQGHAYLGTNVIVSAKGKRSCRECQKRHYKTYRSRRRERLAAQSQSSE